MRKRGNICSLLMSLFCLSLCIGCGGSRGVGKEEPPHSDEAPPALTRFDPLELRQDREIVPARYPHSGAVRSQGGDIGMDEPDSTVPSATSTLFIDRIDRLNNQSFRIQIFTSKLYGEAQYARMIAEEIFDRTVYLDYEVPYFKVRVGSFADRDTAETYQQRARAAGYANAWVVMVNVGIEEQPLLYDSPPSPVGDTLDSELDSQYDQ
ncbi:MAG: SPOR domain-containing protein [candidate division Zixibacteria bacterium]|nr:SPOR domain-containing protein [candidate division Zixibacteria bacterium]